MSDRRYIKRRVYFRLGKKCTLFYNYKTHRICTKKAWKVSLQARKKEYFVIPSLRKIPIVKIKKIPILEPGEFLREITEPIEDNVFKAEELLNYDEVFIDEYIRNIYPRATEEKLIKLFENKITDQPMKMIITEVNTKEKIEIPFKLSGMKEENKKWILINTVGSTVDFEGFTGNVKIELEKWL